eukprot:986475-Pelagomonas_calceolata.AAC.1
MRPGAQLEASQQHHCGLCKQLQKVLRSVTTQVSWVWVGLSILPSLDQFRKLGIDPQQSTNSYGSSMPILCNTRSNLPQPDVPLKK